MQQAFIQNAGWRSRGLAGKSVAAMGFGGALPSGPRIDNHPQRGSFYPSALAVDVLRFLPHRGRDSRAGADYSISSSLTASQDGTLRVRRGVAALGRRTESPAQPMAYPSAKYRHWSAAAGATILVTIPGSSAHPMTCPAATHRHWSTTGRATAVGSGSVCRQKYRRWIVPETDCRADAAIQCIPMGLVIVSHREVPLFDCPTLELDFIGDKPAFAAGIALRLERLSKMDNR